MATIVELDAMGESMWREVTTSWGQQARHDAFIQHCLARGRLAAAAARYRQFLEEHPDDETGRRMRDRVVFLSMQALTAAEPRVARQGLMQSPWFVIVVLAGAVAGALLGFIWGGQP